MNSQKRMVYMQKLFNPRAPSRLSSLSKENFARVMNSSVQKAINSVEGPVKEKHVRRLLIGSYQCESGQFFWQALPIIRLKEDQIICWKFCHVLHKMLRDGHRQVLSSAWDSGRYILMECGSMWRHVEDGYGKLIHKYCRILFRRIVFLTHNPEITNDLRLDDIDDLNCGGNPNLYFSHACELFDMLEYILDLQEAVLTKVNSKGLNSMSDSGQCHLAPLVTCIQDSSMYYDQCVKILFRLHGELSAETLEGHRSRFSKLHDSLKSFYTNASSLQYFKTLIQIPHLTDKAPNFLIASDLKDHVAPQVIMISNPERDSPDELLVNLDDDTESSICDQSEVSDSAQTFHENQSSSLQEGNTSQSPDPFAPSHCTNPHAVHDIQTADTTQTEINEQHESDRKRLEEMELKIKQLESDLELEKANHGATKEKLQSELDTVKDELSKAGRELSNVTHQKISIKNDYDKLLEEYERAKHDFEISQVAMKKMVKELSELRGKQTESQELKRVALVEADSREADQLAVEMNEIDQIIKLATRKIEELSENSRKVETGIKLQVNEKISEVCTNLMKAVKNLIAQSRLLQREIVNLGSSGQMGKDEKHRLKSDWIDGLVSAANRVAISARSLVDVADRVMSGNGKLSELSAAANDIAAANTQLVVASRVKASRDSEKLKLLESAAKQVNQCVSNVVDASRVCAELIDRQSDDIDISALSLHQTKKLEMETQVKLLELEQELNKERARLGLLRRKHYEEEEAAATAAQKNETPTNESKA